MEPFPPFSSDAGDELNVEDAFGEHDIEYWVPKDGRLVPATPEEVAELREREALRRLNRWRRGRMDAQPASSAGTAEQLSRSFASLLVGRAAALVRRMVRRSSRDVGTETPATPAERVDKRVDTGTAPSDAGRIQ